MDRTVKVAVIAEVGGALAQLARLRNGIRTFNSELQAGAVARKATFNDVAMGLGVVGVALGGLAGIAVKKFADFDQAMSYVAAVTRESATAMLALREAALQAGAETVFTAVEAANAIENLAKAGVSTADILGGGLRSSLNLAAASGLSVARAAEIAAGALGMFKLQGSDLKDVTDYLAAGANKSIGEVDDLALALRQVGPVANLTGLSIKETIGALAAFASTGRIGLDAGTSFKRMLQLLTPQSAAAAAKMEELGIAGYDAKGEFIGLANFAGVLRSSLSKLTPEARNAALSTIYGSDAIAAATELYRQGADGIQDWIDKVDDQGYAADNASLRLGNLKGDLEQFKGSLDTVFVTMGEAANGPLRAIVQGATGIINALGGTSDDFQQALFWATAIAGAVSLLGGAFFLAVPKIAAYNQAVGILTASMPKLGSAIGAVGRVGAWLTVAVVAISGIATAVNSYTESLRMNGAELTNVLATTASGANIIKSTFQNMKFDAPKTMEGGAWNESQWQSYTGGMWDASDAAANFNDILSDIADHEVAAGKMFWEEGWGASGGQLGEAAARLRELGESYASLSDTDLPKAQQSFSLLMKETDMTSDSFWDLINLMPAYKTKLVEMATVMGLDATNAQVMMRLAMGKGAEGAEAQKVALGQLSAAAEDTSGEISDLASQIADFGKTQLDTRDGIRRTGDAFRDLRAAVDAGVTAGYSGEEMLNMWSEVGSDVTGKMDAFADSINQTAAAMYTQSGSIEQVNAFMSEQRQKLFETAMQLYGNEDAAWAYVNSLLATPDQIITNVQLNGLGMAQEQLDTWIRINNNRTVSILARMSAPGQPNDPADQPGAATGGTIRGPGTGTSDTAGLFWLSNGEEVIRASMAAKFRPLLKAINAGQINSIPGYADGGTARRYAGMNQVFGGPAAKVVIPPTAPSREFNLTVINPQHVDLMETVREKSDKVANGMW